jgi:nucleotide-binding universal stress UspA family protein
MKLLIGYDGSPCADAALDELHRAGLPHEVEAIVLSVTDAWVPPLGETVPPTSSERIFPAMKQARIVAAQAIEEAHVLAMRACERVQANFPSWQVSGQACVGSPAWEIILKAEAWQVDLVVVGSRGCSLWDRLLLGSVSNMVVSQARCSVRVARGERGIQLQRPLRILVGVDGSTQAEAAVRAVAGRVWPAGSELRVVTATDPRLATGVALPSSARDQLVRPEDEEWQAWISRVVESSADTLRTTGLAVSTVVKDGDPKRVLVEEAKDWEADCIFVGARGLNRLQRFWLGSVSAAVAERAHCTVEVVRHLPVPAP